jgi:hypothetical protein
MKEPLSLIAAEGFDHARSLYRPALNVNKYNASGKATMNAELTHRGAAQARIGNQQSRMAWQVSTVL